MNLLKLLNNFTSLALIYLIRIYQYSISPFLGNNCRFFPSCSSYSIEAVNRFGFIKGSYLAIKRLLRCHPWTNGGVDPVPPKYSCKTCLSQSGSVEEIE